MGSGKRNYNERMFQGHMYHLRNIHVATLKNNILRGATPTMQQMDGQTGRWMDGQIDG